MRSLAKSVRATAPRTIGQERVSSHLEDSGVGTKNSSFDESRGSRRARSRSRMRARSKSPGPSPAAARIGRPARTSDRSIDSDRPNPNKDGYRSVRKRGGLRRRAEFGHHWASSLGLKNRPMEKSGLHFWKIFSKENNLQTNILLRKLTLDIIF